MPLQHVPVQQGELAVRPHARKANGSGGGGGDANGNGGRVSRSRRAVVSEQPPSARRRSKHGHQCVSTCAEDEVATFSSGGSGGEDYEGEEEERHVNEHGARLVKAVDVEAGAASSSTGDGEAVDCSPEARLLWPGQKEPPARAKKTRANKSAARAGGGGGGASGAATRGSVAKGGARGERRDEADAIARDALMGAVMVGME